MMVEGELLQACKSCHATDILIVECNAMSSYHSFVAPERRVSEAVTNDTLGLKKEESR